MLLGSAILGPQEVKDMQIMSGLDAVLVQYQVYAQRRLHFGRMFWANIAFMIVVLIVIAAVVRGALRLELGWVSLGAGFATVQMAYIAHRLRKMEDQCEQLMTDIEVTLKETGQVGVVIAPRSGRWSARNMAVMSLGFLGAVLLAVGAFALLIWDH
jgi:hypothetical protein